MRWKWAIMGLILSSQMEGKNHLLKHLKDLIKWCKRRIFFVKQSKELYLLPPGKRRRTCVRDWLTYNGLGLPEKIAPIWAPKMSLQFWSDACKKHGWACQNCPSDLKSREGRSYNNGGNGITLDYDAPKFNFLRSKYTTDIALVS